jgi:hypothetical protein
LYGVGGEPALVSKPVTAASRWEKALYIVGRYATSIAASNTLNAVSEKAKKGPPGSDPTFELRESKDNRLVVKASFHDEPASAQ